RGEDVVAEPPGFERAGLEVLDHDVHERHEPLEQRLPGRLAKIARHGLLVPSLDGPEERIAVDERPDRAHEVAPTGKLDLDDLGAEIGEQRRGERRADAGAEIEHADAGERAHRARYPARGAGCQGAQRTRGSPRTRSARMLRWISEVAANRDAAR